MLFVYMYYVSQVTSLLFSLVLLYYALNIIISGNLMSADILYIHVHNKLHLSVLFIVMVHSINPQENEIHIDLIHLIFKGLPVCFKYQIKLIIYEFPFRKIIVG